MGLQALQLWSKTLEKIIYFSGISSAYRNPEHNKALKYSQHSTPKPVNIGFAGVIGFMGFRVHRD